MVFNEMTLIEEIQYNFVLVSKSTRIVNIEFDT